MSSCCQHFRNEFKRPMFGIDEDPNGKLNMDASFQIGNKGSLSSIAVIKFVTFAIAVATLVYSFTVADIPSFYPAFLTPWGVFFGILQLGGSFVLTTFYKPGYNPDNRNILVKITWLLYSVAAVIGVTITVLFWVMVFDPNKENNMLDKVMTHGGVVLLVILQGIFLDAVPMRLKHLAFSDGVAILFSVWLALQNTVIQYNPHVDDDDDAVYDAMRFKKDTSWAIILVLLVVFVAVPIIHLLLWFVSLPARRYAPSGTSEDDKEEVMEQAPENDVEGNV